MPTSGSINLLQWVTELRKTSLLTRLLIYYKRILKDMNQQPATEIDIRDTQGEILNKGTSLFLAHGSVLVSQHGSSQKMSQKAVLRGFYGDIII